MHWQSEGFSIEDYLSLNGNYLVEYVDGCLQVLPTPDGLHQALLLILATLFREYAKTDANAAVKVSPFKVMLNETQFREPDICFMTGSNARRRTRKFWMGADLVVEIVSESNPEHDLDTKMREYANGGIPEYWIVDPIQRAIRIFSLSNAGYVSAGTFGAGQFAVSPSLKGFTVDVGDLFVQGEAEA